MKTRILLLFTLALLFSACAAPGTPQPVATELPPTEALSTPEVTLPPTENLPAMTTYTDDIASFSLDYPAGWSLETSALVHAEEASNYSISIASWDILNPPTPSGKQLTGMPEGGTKFDVTVIKDATTLEAAIEQVRQSGTPILTQKDVTLTNGVPGIILDYESFAGPGKMLISIMNGNFIYVTGYGNLEYFEPIALSLRAK